MNELSLFTGAGGGVLASILLGWRVVGYVEYDEYCQKVIRQRIKDGIYDDAPIFGDIRGFDGCPFRGVVDIVTAGFPCQPFSVAGKRAGADDERNMWPETLRVIREVRPRYALLENVPGLISSGYFERILCDLAESGYDAGWCCLGADDVGAPHRRKRLWILAYAQSGRTNGKPGNLCEADGRQGRTLQGQPIGASDVAYAPLQRERNLPGERKNAGGPGEEHNRAELAARRQDVADTERPRLEGDESARDTRSGGCVAERSSRVTWWDTDPADVGDTGHAESAGRRGRQDKALSGGQRGMGHIESGSPQGEDEICDPRSSGLSGNNGRGAGQESQDGCSRPAQPRLGRVAHGVAHRVNRLKAIGNGQVPAVVAAAWQILIEKSMEDENG